MKKMEVALEQLLFGTRWLLAPFYIGLVGALVMLLMKFGQEFFHILPHVFEASEKDVIIAILALVDMSLVSNLLLIIIFSGYESFVSKMHIADHEDRPEWMGKMGFSDLKIKVFASIVAISGIELLKAFMNLDLYTNEELAWKVGLHMAFVLSGVLFALMDRLSGEH